MPSAMVAPVAAMDPPFAGIPFTVGNSRAVSKSQIIFPVLVSYARICPSIEGAKTTPGIALGGDFNDTEQPRRPAQPGTGAGSFQTILPVAGSIAKSPVLAVAACAPRGASP